MIIKIGGKNRKMVEKLKVKEEDGKDEVEEVCKS